MASMVEGGDAIALTPYEAGFVDAVLHLQGILHPTEQQYIDTLKMLDLYARQRWNGGQAS